MGKRLKLLGLVAGNEALRYRAACPSCDPPRGPRAPLTASNACARPSRETVVSSQMTTSSSRGRMPPLARVELRVGRRNDAGGDPQDGIERVHRIEAPVEAEDVLVQVGLEVLRFDTAVMRAVEPGLQVAEDEVDHRQVLFGVLGVAGHRQNVEGVAVPFAEVAIAV